MVRTPPPALEIEIEKLQQLAEDSAWCLSYREEVLFFCPWTLEKIDLKSDHFLIY